MELDELFGSFLEVGQRVMGVAAVWVLPGDGVVDPDRGALFERHHGDAAGVRAMQGADSAGGEQGVEAEGGLTRRGFGLPWPLSLREREREPYAFARHRPGRQA